MVAKFDVQNGKLVDSWQAEPHEFISESVVVPKQGGKEEDDVYLMTMVFDGKTSKSHLLIFDAKSVGKGKCTRSRVCACLSVRSSFHITTTQCSVMTPNNHPTHINRSHLPAADQVQHSSLPARHVGRGCAIRGGRRPEKV